MNTLRFGAACGVTLALLLGACSSSGSSSNSASAKIDSQGGSLGGTGSTGGFLLQIPAGALAQETTITIDPTSPSPSTNAVGNAAVFGPAGLTFANPVELTLPFDPSRVTNPAALVVFRRDVTGAINQIPIPNGGLGASTAKIQINGFSAYWVGTPGGTGGSNDLTGFFPLGNGDSYTFRITDPGGNFDQQFVVDTDPPVSRPPVATGLPVILFGASETVGQGTGLAGPLFTNNADGIELAGTFVSSTFSGQTSEFYDIYDMGQPFLPSNVTFDQELVTTVQSTEFSGTTQSGSSTIEQRVTWSVGEPLTVTAGTFNDVVEVSAAETVTDTQSQQVSSRSTSRIVFARGVGPIFIESTDLIEMVTETQELLSAVVGGNPIGGGQ